MISRYTRVVAAAVAAVALLAGSAQAGAPEKPSIVEVAQAVNAANGEFSILLAAVGAAHPGVAAALAGKGQLTVFAPTDAAFVSLLAELGLTADELLADRALVTQVLLYHVLHGRRTAADVLASTRLRTLQRGFLHQSSGVLTDNEGRTASIIAVDIEARNGIIHVIDNVVLP